MVNEYKVNIDENNERFTKNLFYDPIDCFKYVFKDPTTLSEGTPKLSTANDAMSHRAAQNSFIRLPRDEGVAG